MKKKISFCMEQQVPWSRIKFKFVLCLGTCCAINGISVQWITISLFPLYVLLSRILFFRLCQLSLPCFTFTHKRIILSLCLAFSHSLGIVVPLSFKSHLTSTRKKWKHCLYALWWKLGQILHETNEFFFLFFFVNIPHWVESYLT